MNSSNHSENIPQELRESDEGAFTEVATTVAEPMAAEAAAQAAGKAWEKMGKMAIFMAFEAFFSWDFWGISEIFRRFSEILPGKTQNEPFGTCQFEGSNTKF